MPWYGGVFSGWVNEDQLENYLLDKKYPDLFEYGQAPNSENPSDNYKQSHDDIYPLYSSNSSVNSSKSLDLSDSNISNKSNILNKNTTKSRYLNKENKTLYEYPINYISKKEFGINKINSNSKKKEFIIEKNKFHSFTFEQKKYHITNFNAENEFNKKIDDKIKKYKINKNKLDTQYEINKKRILGN